MRVDLPAGKGRSGSLSQRGSGRDTEFPWSGWCQAANPQRSLQACTPRRSSTEIPRLRLPHPSAFVLQSGVADQQRGLAPFADFPSRRGVYVERITL